MVRSCVDQSGLWLDSYSISQVLCTFCGLVSVRITDSFRILYSYFHEYVSMNFLYPTWTASIAIKKVKPYISICYLRLREKRRHNIINVLCHDDVIKWKPFPRYWPFVWGIHWSPVNTPHKGQWRGALMILLSASWINGWANNRVAGDLRRHRAHYDAIVMSLPRQFSRDVI